MLNVAQIVQLFGEHKDLVVNGPGLCPTSVHDLVELNIEETDFTSGVHLLGKQYEKIMQ